jgi:CubicO group peptidase (beta-lactamase class C family)
MSNENIPVPVETELDALFGQYTAANQARGLVYGLLAPEGLVHCAGFGVVNDAGLGPDENTVFPIASMSKSFIACAALLARDRGALSLEDPITKWVPEFSATGTIEDPCQPPTVRMLFSMSGGLTEDNSWVDPLIEASEQDLLAQVSRGLRYSHVPGTVHEYSNSAWMNPRSGSTPRSPGTPCWSWPPWPSAPSPPPCSKTALAPRHRHQSAPASRHQPTRA